MRRLAAEREAAAGAADPRAVVVHDIPLLVETGDPARFHCVVVVHTPEDVRVDRLVSSRGLSEDEARARLAAQADDAARLAAADVTLDGSGEPDDARARRSTRSGRVCARRSTRRRGGDRGARGVTVVVSGFEPFGGDATNPSWETAERLAARGEDLVGTAWSPCGSP